MTLIPGYPARVPGHIVPPGTRLPGRRPGALAARFSGVRPRLRLDVRGLELSDDTDVITASGESVTVFRVSPADAATASAVEAMAAAVEVSSGALQ